MKRILFLILLIASYFGVNAQANKTLLPLTGGVNGIAHTASEIVDSFEYKISGCGAPTRNVLAYMAVKKGSGEYVDTCGKQPYWYSPSDSTWFTVSGLPYNGDSNYYVGGDRLLHTFDTLTVVGNGYLSNDTLFITGGSETWEQTLTNQGSTPFTTDNTVNIGAHNLSILNSAITRLGSTKENTDSNTVDAYVSDARLSDAIDLQVYRNDFQDYKDVFISNGGVELLASQGSGDGDTSGVNDTNNFTVIPSYTQQEANIGGEVSISRFPFKPIDIDHPQYYIPLSVNNNYADAAGNITVGAASDSLFGLQDNTSASGVNRQYDGNNSTFTLNENNTDASLAELFAVNTVGDKEVGSYLNTTDAANPVSEGAILSKDAATYFAIRGNGDSTELGNHLDMHVKRQDAATTIDSSYEEISTPNLFLYSRDASDLFTTYRPVFSDTSGAQLLGIKNGLVKRFPLSLLPSITGKLNISDTAAMLAPYLRTNIAAATYTPLTRSISTGYGLSGGGDFSTNRTHIVDSATLSLTYVRHKDSSVAGGYYPFSTNPKSYLVAADIAGKLNISDTATMLSPYLRTNIAAATYVPLTRTVAGFALSSNVTLGALTATNSTLTFSGSYDGSTARTAAINLANANTWTAKQTMTADATNAGFNLAGVAADPNTPVAGDIWRRTDSVGIRFYDGTTKYWMSYASGETTYAGTITWDGTPPTTIANQTYQWTQNYKTVTLRINVVYTNAGTTNGTATLTIPSGLPTPATVTGFTANSSIVTTQNGTIGAAVTTSFTGAQKATLGLDGSGAPIITIVSPTAGAAKVIRALVIYTIP